MEKSDFKISLRFRIIKRSLDLILSICLFFILLIPILLIALISFLITLSSPFYFDVRIGKHNKVIKVLKLRSMTADANKHPEKYLTKEQMEQFIRERKVDNDPRVTKFGRILRKTSIDEVPQIINIIIGDMSFVGPRPITQQEIDKHFTAEQANLMLSVRPGLTGKWQVSGRNKIEFETGERQRIELSYFKHLSIFNDFKIFLKTFIVIFRHSEIK